MNINGTHSARSFYFKPRQVTINDIVLHTIQIVSKQLHIDKWGKKQNIDNENCSDSAVKEL